MHEYHPMSELDESHGRVDFDVTIVIKEVGGFVKSVNK
jgi:hypothetical protein